MKRIAFIVLVFMVALLLGCNSKTSVVEEKPLYSDEIQCIEFTHYVTQPYSNSNDSIQKQVNDWLSQNHYEIVDIFYSTSDTTISNTSGERYDHCIIFYKVK